MRVSILAVAALAAASAAIIPSAFPGIAWAQKPPPKIVLPRPGFEEIGQERGVTVYQNDSADLIWIAAIGRLPASPEQVQAALLDYEHQVGRIGRVSEVNVLSREPGAVDVYERLNLPVISDRDFTLRVTHGNEGARRWIAYWAVTDRGPKPRDGIVRVTRSRGVWDLAPVPGGKGTIVRYEMRIDLAGDVPLWMVRSGAGDEIPTLYSQICKLAVGQAEQASCP